MGFSSLHVVFISVSYRDKNSSTRLDSVFIHLSNIFTSLICTVIQRLNKLMLLFEYVNNIIQSHLNFARSIRTCRKTYIHTITLSPFNNLTVFFFLNRHIKGKWQMIKYSSNTGFCDVILSMFINIFINNQITWVNFFVSCDTTTVGGVAGKHKLFGILMHKFNTLKYIERISG
jgi:hypothetical protein